MDELSEDFQSRFLPREIEILCKIDHVNIVRIYKIFSYPSRVYIFMELVIHGDLRSHIRNRGLMSEPLACHYFKQIVSAIRYLHSLNVAHRDLKCENIMINQWKQIKIIDFGFSRSTMNENGRRQLSQTFCGSLAYAAPEILMGIPYNAMMYDVWSLGCVLFFMVTGNTPFDNSSMNKLLSDQMKRRIRYPRTFLGSDQVKDLISRMLEPDVIRRVNIKQVDRSDWIQRYSEKYLFAHKGNPNLEDALPRLRNPESPRRISRGTQTTPINSEDSVSRGQAC